MIKITVDNQTLEVKEGISVLEACLENGIFIPNLCFLKERERPHASCRLCFVEVEGLPAPVTSCTLPVKDGMVIRTDTPEVRRLQKTAFKLIMSGHPCHAKKCPVGKNCTLMKIAKFLGVGLGPKPYERLDRDLPELIDFGFMYYSPYRCVLCAKCIHVCKTQNGKPLLTFARRGFDTIVAFFNDPDEKVEEKCKNCQACTSICPTGALVFKSEESDKAYEAQTA